MNLCLFNYVSRKDNCNFENDDDYDYDYDAADGDGDENNNNGITIMKNNINDDNKNMTMIDDRKHDPENNHGASKFRAKKSTWQCLDMETLSTLLAICEGIHQSASNVEFLFSLF